MSQDKKVAGLLSQAAGRGTVPDESLVGLRDLGAEIANALGISVDDVSASEVFLLTMVIDDSGSIRFAGNSDFVRDGHNFVLDELKKSNKGDDILVHTSYLNDGTLFPYCLLGTAKKLDQGNYNPGGSTPLYDQSLAVLGTVLAKEQEFANQGVPVRAVTVIITDGADTSSRRRAAEVATLVRKMISAENHIVAFMGIDDGSTDFREVAREMGISDEWILTPKNDGHSIRQAFGVVSRISKSASQGAASFSAVAQTGFGAGIN